MKLRTLDFLVCPIDKTPLELIEWESVQTKLSDDEISRAKRLGIDPGQLTKEVISGLLLNPARKIFYPIHEGIPRLLIFPTALTQAFLKRYRERIEDELPGFRLPDQKPMPGEESIFRTFSSEWTKYNWNSRSYWFLTPDGVFKSMWSMLDIDSEPVRDKLVLEIGIGIGATADYISRTGGCEMAGIDLSHAVDGAYREFGRNKFLHIVQASLFALPFREGSFDFVFSHGVLHHTFSTKTAFDYICKLPKIDGHLYIWVYSIYNEQRDWVRGTLMLLEKIIRPICWRMPEGLQTALLLPLIPFYLTHQNLFVRRKRPGCINYGWNEAIHAARDRFTPRFAYRHSYDEVSGWFRNAGYAELRCNSKRNFPISVPIPLVNGVGVKGRRRDE